MSLSKSIYALVIIPCDKQLDVSGGNMLYDCQIAPVKILIFINKKVPEVIFKLKIPSLFESLLELVNEFRSQCIPVDLTMFSPRTKKTGVGEPRFPVTLIGCQALPVCRKLIQEVTGIVDSSKLEESLQVFEDYVALFPVIRNSERLGQV
jgi:hypothetical protein